MHEKLVLIRLTDAFPGEPGSADSPSGPPLVLEKNLWGLMEPVLSVDVPPATQLSLRKKMENVWKQRG